MTSEETTPDHSRDTDLELPSKARMEAFSDGVFAIAITLLVLEIAVPHLKAGENLTRALLDEWPSYIGYALSFVTIGIMWVNHDALIKDITHADRPVMLLNLLLLMLASFVPFPTAVLAEYLRDGEQRLVATVLYGGCFTAMAIVWNAIWFYVVNRKLLSPRVSEARVRARTRIYLASPLVFGAGIPMAFITPWLSLAFYALLDLAYVFPTKD